MASESRLLCCGLGGSIEFGSEILMSFWRGRNVLVTGCTGFLGFWLTRALLSKGANVVGLVRDVVPQAPLFLNGLDQQITIVRGCVKDRLVIERMLNEYEIDAVFHL